MHGWMDGWPPTRNQCSEFNDDDDYDDDDDMGNKQIIKLFKINRNKY